VLQAVQANPAAATDVPRHAVSDAVNFVEIGRFENRAEISG
jgi:hypothetical protein